MSVKLFPENLNRDLYPPHLTSTYTYGVWLSRQGCAVVGKKKKRSSTSILCDFMKMYVYIKMPKTYLTSDNKGQAFISEFILFLIFFFFFEFQSMIFTFDDKFWLSNEDTNQIFWCRRWLNPRFLI